MSDPARRLGCADRGCQSDDIENAPDTDADTIAVGVFEDEGIAHDLPDGGLTALLDAGEARRVVQASRTGARRGGGDSCSSASASGRRSMASGRALPPPSSRAAPVSSVPARCAGRCLTMSAPTSCEGWSRGRCSTRTGSIATSQRRPRRVGRAAADQRPPRRLGRRVLRGHGDAVRQPRAGSREHARERPHARRARRVCGGD